MGFVIGVGSFADIIIRGGRADWWDPNNAGLSIAGAYRAINSVGTPWPGGSTTYAQSLVNQANPGVNDLVEGNGAVPWVQATGWGFVAGNAQWLDTGLIPANDQSWSMLIQFNPTALNGLAALAGAQSAAGLFRLITDNVGAHRRFYGNGGGRTTNLAVAAANMGVAGAFGYWNGIVDTGLIGPWTGPSTFSVFIGALNAVGVAGTFGDHDIAAVAFYNGGAAAVQAEALAIRNAMLAL